MQPLTRPQNKYWLTFGLCALAAALVFLPFYIVDGGIFLYAGDFNSQQISFYYYANEFIKSGGGTFSWATDLGSDFWNSYSFYLAGSPFFWLTLLFPAAWQPFLMAPMLVLKFAVAGGGAYLWTRRWVKDPNMAVLAGLTGLMVLARKGSIDGDTGTSYEMDAIGSCFIGGASAYGGTGTVPGVIIGAVLMGIINQGMSIMGTDQNMQKVVKGLVLLAAVIFDVVSKRKSFIAK